MYSPASFTGNCWTLLIGGALSWYTVTNANVSNIVAALFGRQSHTEARSTGERSPDGGDSAELVLVPSMVAVSEESGNQDGPRGESFAPPMAVSPTSRAAERIKQISTRLRQLGASYLLLERLPGIGPERYRARCDVSPDNLPLNYRFEATESAPELALEEILQAVLDLEKPSV
jgi:hypothetical protein